MDILLKAATIIDTFSAFHLQKADLFISNGQIVSISAECNNKADKVINVEGLFVSPGFIDVFAHFNDPGYEYKETLETGAAAAAAGGYTDVFVLPNTNPVIQNKGTCQYIVQKSGLLPVMLHPIGAVTKNIEGKELTEMYDMEQSGAVAFSDGTQSVQSTGLLLKALQYVKAVDKTIIQMPDDKSINAHGLMNEGVVSTGLGLPGKPAIGEELAIVRDIELAKYTSSKLHITGVSSKKGIELIKKAKTEGIPVSCSVTPYHLVFCDEDLAQYDTNLKVSPPLRTTEDRAALQAAVLDGTVDCIASHHNPQDLDQKEVEFEYAKNGMIGLQTCFAAVATALPQISAEKLVALFSTNAAKLFGLHQHTISENAPANLSLFSLQQQWTFTPDQNLSRSDNSAFFGKQFTAKPLGIISKDGLFLNPL